MSESWGVRPDGESGKVVWFTLPTSAPVVTSPSLRSRRTVQEKPARRFAEVGVSADGLRPDHAPARSAVAG